MEPYFSSAKYRHKYTAFIVTTQPMDSIGFGYKPSA